MTEEQMRSEFEKRFPIPDGVAWIDSGNYGVVARGQRAMLSASSYRAMWKAWQAARTVPEDVRATGHELLACFKAWEPDVRVLGNVKAGDAADALSYMLSAAPEGKK